MTDENKNSPSSFDVNATSIFHTFGADASKPVRENEEPVVLFCRYANGASSWQQKNFHPGKGFLKIGTEPVECDLALPHAPGFSRLHIALRLVFDNWFVLEYSAERSMSINGIRRSQAILKEGDACIVSVGNSQIALHAMPRKKAAKDLQSFDPMKPVLSFRTKDREFKMGLDATSALIGSDPECGIQSVALTPVSGSVFVHRGRPYIYSAKSATPLALDGVDASSGPRELLDGAVVSLGKSPVFSVGIKPAIESVQATPPQDYKGGMVLLDISNNRFGSKLILPPAGRSIMIGRDNSNHFMLESPSVSKKHAQLIIYENSVLVLDARSTNGTYVEEEPITKKLIHPGEIVRFADKSFLLCYPE